MGKAQMTLSRLQALTAIAGATFGISFAALGETVMARREADLMRDVSLLIAGGMVRVHYGNLFATLEGVRYVRGWMAYPRRQEVA